MDDQLTAIVASLALSLLACESEVMGGLADGSRGDSGRRSDSAIAVEGDGGSTAGRDGGSAYRDGATVLPTPLGCDSEPALGDRRDVVFCEPWETDDWWRNPFRWVKHARLTPQEGDFASEDDVSMTAIEADPSQCRNGRCLRVHTPRGNVTGVAVHWPLAHAGIAPERLYMRYYLRLAPSWTPRLCEPDGSEVSGGGKFPGLADVRVNGDPEAPDGQCGNGGAPGDGLNCWSHRALFRHCGTGSGGVSACSAVPGAITRYGGYLYFGDGIEQHYQEHAIWDSDYWGQSGGDSCETNRYDVNCVVPASDRGTASTDPRNTRRTYGVLVPDRWYAMEVFIQMNTPGLDDGVIRGWVDGTLAYEKTNMVFRASGHHGLHVRSFWLNVHHGGDVPLGACDDNTVWIDQLVLATDAPIGVLP